jgi:hypothetical protein
MRLTLRTLLSWRDGMLDDAAAAALGERVAASPAAGQLHDRIREVVARPMLSAPAPEGSGLAADANSTAEYLDNVMPGERIEEFERVCFGSDVQLAEAAGCHEILAELHRNPGAEAAIDRTTVVRLLAAARAAEGREFGTSGREAPGRASRPRGSGRRRLQRPVGNPKRASAAAWLMAIAAALLLAALLGVFGWSIGRGGSRVAAERRERSVAPANVAPVPDSDRTPPPPPAVAATAEAVTVPDAPQPEPPRAEAPASLLPPAAISEPNAPPEPPPAEPAVAAAAAPPAAVPVPPVPAPPASPAAGLSVPHGDALAIASRPAEAAAVTERAPGGGGDTAVVAAPAAVPVDPAAAPPAEAAVVAGATPLLVRGAAAAEWEVAGDAMPIHLPAELLVPAAGAAALVVDGIRVVLGPSARAGLARAPDGTPRLEMIFGSAVVAAAHGQRLGVSAGGLHGMLEDFAGPVAIDVALDRQPGTEPGVVVTRASIVAGDAVTFVPEAAADDRPAPVGVGPRCTIAGAALEPPAAAAALHWSSVEPNALRLEPLAKSPAVLAASWPTPASDRAAGAAFAARLRPGVDVVEALRGLAADRRGENRSAAVATLALLGHFSPLAEQLCTDDPRRMLYERQWRQLATEAVPLALARGVNAATKLRAALVEAGPPGGGEELVPLASGFSDAELAAGADAALVAALESPHLVVRRWALANLVAIVRPQIADEARYRADATADARRAGVAWWRGMLEQGRIRRESSVSPQADQD